MPRITALVAILGLAMLLMASGAVALDTETRSLEGLKGVMLRVYLQDSDLTRLGLGEEGLTKKIRARLENGGVRVMSAGKGQLSKAQAQLELRVFGAEMGGQRSYWVRMRLQQMVTTTGDQWTYAPTWEHAWMVSAKADEAADMVERYALDFTDNFVYAFRQANPAQR